jgi:ABC-type multidrug transport system permease subunit
VSAYSLSWFISELPYVFLLVALHVNVFYWLCGYSSDWYRFLFFW